MAVLSILDLDHLAVGAFVLTATSLLGSPGPGITALVATGRTEGLKAGLRFYAGLQFGLAIAAATAAAGIATVLLALPWLTRALSLASFSYLMYLAYQIGTAPVGDTDKTKSFRSSMRDGVVLGLINPKTLIAFASLFGMHTIVSGSAQNDLILKWLLCVAIMIVVDLAWLMLGVALHQHRTSSKLERCLNVALALAIMLSAAGLLI